jgi:hypothetical protein
VGEVIDRLQVSVGRPRSMKVSDTMNNQSTSSDSFSGRTRVTLSRVAVGVIAAAGVTIVFNALLTIATRYFQPLNDVAAQLAEHRWIASVVIVFVVLGWALIPCVVRRPGRPSGSQSAGSPTIC